MTQCNIVEILEARERRQKRRRDMTGLYGGTAISLQLNIPGEVKTSIAYRKVLDIGVQEIERQGDKHWKPLLKEEVHYLKTGPEALFIFRGEPLVLKAMMVDIEEHHPLGRLFDIDVYDKYDRPISRRRLGKNERSCFVCEGSAKVCGRSKRHQLSTIIESIHDLIQTYENNKGDTHEKEVNVNAGIHASSGDDVCRVR